MDAALPRTLVVAVPGSWSLGSTWRGGVAPTGRDDVRLRAERPWRQRLDDLVRWAGSKSNYFSKGFLNLFAGGVVFASPTHEYVALLTVVPDDTSTGATITETDYGSYARTEIGTGNNQTDAWNAATGATSAISTNKNAINFPQATTPSTNPIVGIAILDSSTPGAGNILWWATVTSTPITTGDIPRVPASGISITED